MQNVAVLQQYEHLTIGERKHGGVFYTPQYLADYLAEKLVSFSKIDLESRISLLDPACGNGILLEAFLNKISKNHTAKNIKVCGSDIDNVAVTATQQRLAKFGSTTIIHADAITPVKNKTNKNGWLELKNSYFNVHDFNFIVSNPPWGAQLTHFDKNWLAQNFVLAKGQFDSFNLFTEIILENLGKDGYYALILPDSVFNQEQWRFRKKLLDTKILFIARLGEKIFDEINRACTLIKRQYAANYHILETLAREDEPEAIGESGLRPWRDQYSDFCSKVRIRNSFDKIFKNVQCSDFLISYSEDGLIPIDDLLSFFSNYGTVSKKDIEYKRFKSNNNDSNPTLIEYLIHLHIK